MTQIRRIAVVIREREAEALRMALGLTLVDDLIDVYVLDRRLADEGDSLLNIELMKDSGIGIYSNVPDDSQTQYLAAADIARRLLDYDHVLPY